MTLTPEQITIVEQYPLKNALDQSRANLREFLPSDDSWRSGIAELLDVISLSLASGLLLAPNKNSPDRHQMCNFKNLLKEHRNGNWEGLPMNANEHVALETVVLWT
ncbi:hypothetical protein E4U37_006354 [Claviceps purpurea]|nr:hypothetical protein E4U37_006354 [Claviceps purpurea]